MTEKHMNCRECLAGFNQALMVDTAWSCPHHGIQRLAAYRGTPIPITADFGAALDLLNRWEQSSAASEATDLADESYELLVRLGVYSGG